MASLLTVTHFNAPPNEAVITLKSILEAQSPVLYVVNEEAGWQFLSGPDLQPSEARVVALQRLLDLDPSLSELGDLPEGWCAWRATPTSPWQRVSL